MKILPFCLYRGEQEIVGSPEELSVMSPVVVDVVVLVDIPVKTERSKLLYKYFIILHFFLKIFTSALA